MNVATAEYDLFQFWAGPDEEDDPEVDFNDLDDDDQDDDDCMDEEDEE